MNVFQAFISASRNVILPRFEAGAALAAIAAEGVTQSLLVPTMLGMILDHDGESFDERALIDFSRGTLSGYKLPRSIEHRDELPLTAAGKVMKRELRAPFWAHLAPPHTDPAV